MLLFLFFFHLFDFYCALVFFSPRALTKRTSVGGLEEWQLLGEENGPADEQIWLGKCLEVRNALFQKQQKRAEAIDRSGA